MSWPARLELRAQREGERCVVHAAHEGPLRVLKTLHPEGAAVAHAVVVHPPGGIVGGDRLTVTLDVQAAAHLLVTTPGATRFYRSAGEAATQQVRAKVAAGARLEWLPLETLAHSGCLARNDASFVLAPGAEMIGWDLLSLGLPAAGDGFEAGRFEQHLEVPGAWLERGVVDAADVRLRQSPLGWAGRSSLLTMWFAAGEPLAAARVEALLAAARELTEACGPASTVAAGVTQPAPRVLVMRALAQRVEPAMQLARAVRAAWRPLAWGLADEPPRVWST